MAPTLPDPISDFSSSSMEDERLRRPKRRACLTLLNALLGLLQKKKTSINSISVLSYFLNSVLNGIQMEYEYFDEPNP